MKNVDALTDNKSTFDPDEIELTVIAPMYNEADNIETTISMIKETLNDFDKPWELLLVDDGSDDNTLEIARRFETKMPNLRVLHYPVNCGRGKALRTGFNYARGKYIVTTDFDLSYSPHHIIQIYEQLTNPTQMNDIVLGSAYMKDGKVIGVLNCFTDRPHVFSDTEINLITAVANQAGVAIMNTELIVKTKVIQEELETRKLVERAKDVLIRRRNMTGGEAYRWLQKRSMDSRKSIRMVADAVLLSEEV